MHNDSFHLTNWKGYKAGDVVRMSNLDSPFFDAVILGFNEDEQVKVARPYCYASLTGTTGPSPLLGCEVYIVPALRLLRKVGDGYTA